MTGFVCRCFYFKTDIENGELEVNPRYRSKSVGRMLEEIDLITEKNFIEEPLKNYILLKEKSMFGFSAAT